MKEQDIGSTKDHDMERENYNQRDDHRSPGEMQSGCYE